MKTRALCCIILLIPLIWHEADADILNQVRQSLQSGRGSSLDRAADSLLRLPGLQPRLKASQLMKSEGAKDVETLLDKAIDPEKYTVGPGDRFLIYMWGKLEEYFDVVINSEGVVLLPLIGVVDLRGKTLAEAKALLEAEALKAYRGVKVAVSLAGVRKFRCYVVGEVARPGAYIVTGVTRVSDVIGMAGGISDSGAVRGIIIANERLGQRTADMAAFFNSISIDDNPYLREGDRVFVSKRKEYVAISGFVNYPGEYDFCEGDKLGDLIEAAGGLSRGADTTRIVVTRFTDDRGGMSRQTVTMAGAAGFPLEKDDRVLVSGVADYRKHYSVVIQGEVRFPGTYPISENTTRLLDVIEMAGGLTDRAWIAGSQIIRDTISFADPLEYERLRPFAEAGLDPIQTSYVKSRVMQEEGLVNVDFSRLGNGASSAANIVMRNGDRIIIARREPTVRVSGAVASPGHVSFREGAGYTYYVGQAGGYSRTAKRTWVRIRRQGSRLWQDPRSAGGIQPGDEILIAEKPYRESFFTVRDVIVILSSAATVILMIVTIQERLSS